MEGRRIEGRVIVYMSRLRRDILTRAMKQDEGLGYDSTLDVTLAERTRLDIAIVSNSAEMTRHGPDT